MKILFLCPYLPVPSQGGGGTSNYYYVRNLSRNHEIHLVVLSRATEHDVPDDLRRYCRKLELWPLNRFQGLLNAFVALFGHQPLRLAYAHSAPLDRRVKELLATGHFDVAISSNERMGQYILNAPRTKRIIDLQDVVSDRHRMLARATRNPIMRVIHNWEAGRMADYEIACLEQFDAVWVTTDDEAGKLSAHDVRGRVRVTLRGIDLSSFPFGLDNKDSSTVMFSGHMSYEPNVDGVLYYLREIHDLIRRALPAVRFQIVGNYPHRKIVRAAAKADGVVVTGRVPSMAEYLRKARVFVAPLRIGTGIRIKLLEAFAIGLPVVCTTAGCRGLDVQHKEQLLIADSPEEFAGAVRRLFEDQALYDRLSRNGRAFVEQNYSLDRAASQIEGILRDLVSREESSKERRAGWTDNTNSTGGGVGATES